jgi:hypothetical protein
VTLQSCVTNWFDLNRKPHHSSNYPGEWAYQLRVDIHYDGFPTGTGWKLECEGVRVARSKMRYVKDEEVLLSTYIKNIRAEICEFEIKDKFAYGLMVPVLRVGFAASLAPL